MTIKKIVLTATAVATVFAFTVPVSFAACSTGSACSIDSLQQVNPSIATCSKCKSSTDLCKCKKRKVFSETISKETSATPAKREQQHRAILAR